MLDEDKHVIEDLRKNGLSYAQIANETGWSVNTIKSHFRRQEEKKRRCKYCGKPLVFVEGKKKKSFCGDRCRAKWWSLHHNELKSTLLYKLICANCGKEFESYGNKNRKYCCHSCYIQRRYGVP